MKTITLLAACLLFAGLAISADVLSASLPTPNKVTGEYTEARTADVCSGACFANSEAEFAGSLAVMGWKIEKGSFDGVNLDGLAVMAVVKAQGTLGDYMRASNPAKAVLIIDQRASDEQRVALSGFAHRMGGELLSNVVRVESRLIQFTTNDIHSRRASMVAGELARIETRALEAGDQICRHEEVWYQPLTPVTHAMAAFTLQHTFTGKGLGEIWSSPEKRSAFVGTFDFQN